MPKFVKAYFVDSIDGTPSTDAPLRHGPAKPSKQLSIDAVDRRQRPPSIIGTIPDNEPIADGMTEISQKEHSDLLADFQAWRHAFDESQLEKRRSEMKSNAEQQYAQSLATGFNDSDGIQWQAIPAARDKILDLTQRIQEFRAGNVASALPQGKTTVKLTDATGSPQDVDETKILQLAELGSDHMDAAEDRLEELIAQIMAAQSQGDLDVIDVTTGWPT